MLPIVENQSAWEELVFWALSPDPHKPTQKQFAEAHGISERQVYNWLHSNEFKAAMEETIPQNMYKHMPAASYGLLGGALKGNPFAFEMLWRLVFQKDISKPQRPSPNDLEPNTLYFMGKLKPKGEEAAQKVSDEEAKQYGGTRPHQEATGNQE